MKVLQINAVNKLLSTGRTCTELSEYLNSKEIECQTAYSVGPSTENSYCMNSQISTKTHALLSRITGLQGYFSICDTLKLVNYIKANKFDIVHVRNIHSNNINLKILFKFLAKNDIATVITLHDCWFYTGKCMHYTLDKCYKWKTGCNNCTKLKTDNISWFFDRTSKMWNDKRNLFEKIPRLAVLGVSKWIKNEAQQSFLSSSSIVDYVYDWIDLEVFKERKSIKLQNDEKLKGKTILLGVASGWSDKKGLSSFLQLAGKIDENTVIVLIGNMQQNIQLPHNIINISATDNVIALVEYYSLADVFLQLSPEETFGKVVAEALACSTPVVTVNSTANPELIDNSCGIVVEKNDITSIVQAVKKISTWDKSITKSNCRSFAIQNFDKEICINKQIQIYRQLM